MKIGKSKHLTNSECLYELILFILSNQHILLLFPTYHAAPYMYIIIPQISQLLLHRQALQPREINAGRFYRVGNVAAGFW